MTVQQITVDGVEDLVVDVDDITSWLQATHAVHTALEGRPVQVTAHRSEHLQVQVEWPVFHNLAQVHDG